MFARFRFDAKRPRDQVEEAEEGRAVGEATSTVVSPSSRDRRVRVKAEPQPEPGPPVAIAIATPVAAATETAESLPLAAHKWQERWHAICPPCFDARRTCAHHEERRLRLLIVGHNPSDHAWTSGYSYSNPSNRFWNLLRGNLSPLSWCGILPTDAHLTEQNHLPLVYGVGLTSIGLEPGNDAASYGRETMTRWRHDFFLRLRRHVQQVCRTTHGQTASPDEPCPLPHSPMLVAFSGKRQFSYLFSPPLAKVETFGRQTRLPADWPRECRDDCEVWVLPSSSGRAAMTTAQRAQPYQALADRFHQLPWPEPAAVIKTEKDEPNGYPHI